MSRSYKSTPQFDEKTLPLAIRQAHSTKAGVWGLLVVEKGEVRLIFHEPRREIPVRPGKPAKIPPQSVHHVETAEPMQMHVEFFREEPNF